MHYRCLWIDENFKLFGKDKSKWAKKVNNYLNRETKNYWSIQDQYAVLGGRWTGSLDCKKDTGKSLKDSATKTDLKTKWYRQYLENIGAFHVDRWHCDICDIKDLVSKITVEQVTFDDGMPYGIRFLRKDGDESQDYDVEETIDMINKKQIKGLIIVVDFKQ